MHSWALGAHQPPGSLGMCVCLSECLLCVGVTVNVWGALPCTTVCLVVSVGVGAAGLCIGVNAFAAGGSPQPEQLGRGWAAQGPYPKPCQGLHLAQHPIHQPQLAKGGGAIVLFDIWFVGKRAVRCQRPHVVAHV